MQEPAGGANHGRRAHEGPSGASAEIRSEFAGRTDGRFMEPLGASDWQAAEYLRNTGWTVARVKDPTAAGMTGHRGALHEDEYVDTAVVEAIVERELGYDLEQLHSVYSTGGRIPSARRELRDRIDARLLALSRSGANMDLFGRVTGLNPSTLDRALARARAEEVQ